MNMQQKIILMLFLVFMLGGCAAPPTELATTSPDKLEANIVMARNAVKGRGPFGISDRFTIDGKVVAYVTLTWPETTPTWGKQQFESRWYRDDRLIKKSETQHNLSKAPYYLWNEIYPVALGAGKARYELYWNGAKLAEREFEIESVASAKDPVRQSM
jgi:hypothetical protein